MNIYCYYTQSHDVFFREWFTATIQDKFKIVSTRDTTQYCKTASYRTKGWRETQIKKIKLWLRAINTTDVFIGSDVDIQWFGPTKKVLLKELGKRDLAIQSYGGGTVCSGFFICRSNERTKKLWTAVLEGLRNNKSQGEQDILQGHLNNGMVRWTELSRNLFWTPNKECALKNLKVPDKVLLHHATYVVGVDAKIKQMKYVRDIVRQRK